MTVEIVAAKSADSRPIWFIGKNKTEQTALTSDVQAWAKANDFNGESGRILVLPGKDGTIAGALFGTGDDDRAVNRNCSPENWRAASPKATGISKISQTTQNW